MTIVITRPDFFTGEAERITTLLTSGKADLIHIRKPQSSQYEVEQLLEELPATLYPRLVLHDHHSLAIRYGLRGVHLNSRNPEPPASWNGAVSISCHSFDELADCLRQPYTYMSLSPIFDSISKQGYKAAFPREELADAKARGLLDNVFALGGVTFGNLREVVEDMGFAGGAIMGGFWNEPVPLPTLA